MSNYLPYHELTPKHKRYIREAMQASLIDRCILRAAATIIEEGVPCLLEANDPTIRLEYSFESGATEDERTKYLSKSSWSLLLPVWAPIERDDFGRIDSILMRGYNFKITSYTHPESNEFIRILTLEYNGTYQPEYRLMLPYYGQQAGLWLFDNGQPIRLD